MNCLRCGRETTNQQVFCDQCLAEMEHQPVKPGTPVYIPVRKAPPVSKKQPRPSRRKRTPEEQLEHLHRSVRHLRIFCLVLTLLLVLSSLSIFLLWEHKPPNFNIGQNFQTADASTAATTGE